MNRFTRPGSLTLPAFLLIASLAFTLFSCTGGPADGRPYNVDSVKNHVIPLDVAVGYVTNFRNIVDTLNKKCPEFKDSMRMGYSEAFNKDSYDLLLSQKDSLGRYAAGIRIYYGTDKEGNMRLVLVPYDVNGNNILHHLIAVDSTKSQDGGVKPRSLTLDDPQAMEDGQRCPPICPPTGPLDPPNP